MCFQVLAFVSTIQTTWTVEAAIIFHVFIRTTLLCILKREFWCFCKSECTFHFWPHWWHVTDLSALITLESGLAHVMDIESKPFCMLLKKFLFLFGLPGFFPDSVDHLKEEKKKKGQHINIRQVKTRKVKREC